MKFDILYSFREQLEQESEIAQNTKKQYYKFVKKVLTGVDFNTADEISPDAILRGMEKLKTKNDVSAAKKGFEFFARYYPELCLPKQIGQVSKKKRNLKKRKWQPLKLDKLKRTINGMKNKRLKYAYRLMLQTGMRVSEVAQLRKQDITFDEKGEMSFYVEKTKSGCPATIRSTNTYLLSMLPDLLKTQKETDKVFYSAEKMMHEAGQYGFECHDLRRCFAKLKYREIKPELGSYRAVNEVRELLRHESCRTTKIYLRRKIV